MFRTFAFIAVLLACLHQVAGERVTCRMSGDPHTTITSSRGTSQFHVQLVDTFRMWYSNGLTMDCSQYKKDTAAKVAYLDTCEVAIYDPAIFLGNPLAYFQVSIRNSAVSIVNRLTNRTLTDFSQPIALGADKILVQQGSAFVITAFGGTDEQFTITFGYMYFNIDYANFDSEKEVLFGLCSPTHVHNFNQVETTIPYNANTNSHDGLRAFAESYSKANNFPIIRFENPAHISSRQRALAVEEDLNPHLEHAVEPRVLLIQRVLDQILYGDDEFEPEFKLRVSLDDDKDSTVAMNMDALVALGKEYGIEDRRELQLIAFASIRVATAFKANMDPLLTVPEFTGAITAREVPPALVDDVYDMVYISLEAEEGVELPSTQNGMDGRSGNLTVELKSASTGSLICVEETILDPSVRDEFSMSSIQAALGLHTAEKLNADPCFRKKAEKVMHEFTKSQKKCHA